MIMRRRYLPSPLSIISKESDTLGHLQSPSSNMYLPAQKAGILLISVFTFLLICNRVFDIEEVTRKMVTGRVTSFWDLEPPNLFNKPSHSQIGHKTLPKSRFDDRCTIHLISTGTPCLNTTTKTLDLDVIWNWDPEWQNAPKSWLRGSMRSAQRNIEGVRSLRLLTPDVASEGNETSTALHFLDESSRKRKGLVPSWINVEHMSQSLVVDPYWNSVCKLPEDSEKKQLESRLPPAKSTLSLQQLYGVMCKEKLFPLKSPSGVEMMLGMQDALSEDFIFAKENQFFSTDMSSSDFVSPLYGTVLRFGEIGIQSKAEEPKENTKSSVSELSNTLLSRRFGYRLRSKPLDAPITYKKSILREMKETWNTAWSLSLTSVSPSINHFDLPFFYSNYIIERHREALLWSFFFARSDLDGDGTYSKEELMALKEDMGISKDVVATDKQVLQPERETLRHGAKLLQDSLKSVDIPLMRSSEISSSSSDGYSTSARNAPSPYSRGSYDSNGRRPDACVMPAVCFETVFADGKDAKVPVQELYLRFSHQLWMCGDCLIVHLTGKSGTQGLNAFLPREGLKMPDHGKQDLIPQQPVLPSKTYFEHVDYSLAHVASATGWLGLDRRLFVSHLIERYQYLIAQGSNRRTFQPEVASVSADHEEALIQMQGLLRAAPPSVFTATSTTPHPRFEKILTEFFPNVLPFESTK